MTFSLKPSLVTTVKYQLPEHIRLSNPTLATFLEYYYEYLMQSGQPIDFLQNMIEFKDLDFQDNVFNALAIKQLLSLIPPNTVVNKQLLVKKLPEFIKSKGTEESFKFIMKVLFDETAEIEWQSKNVLKASANTYSRVSEVLIETSDDFADSSGCMLQQTDPTLAYAVIDYNEQLSLNGKIYQLLVVKDKTVRGNFSVGGSIKCLKNNINRTYFEITDYYDWSGLTLDGINLTGQFSSISYSGLIIKQIGSDYQATINEIVSRSFTQTTTIFRFSLLDVTGTFGTGQCYIIPPSLLDNHFTKDDYYYGTVAPMLDSISIEKYGSMYKAPMPIKYESGSGTGAETRITGVSSGKIDEIRVVSGGSGYKLGDKVSNIDASFKTRAIDASVSGIDGIGVDFVTTMELNSFVIVSGGTSYKVGDTVSITTEAIAIELTVSSVSSGVVTGLTINNRGLFNTCPEWYKITPNAKTGIGTGLILSLLYRVNSVSLLNGGTGYKNASVAVNNLGGGAVLNSTIVDGCVYLGGITIGTPGSGYTKAYASITSAAGHGVVLTPIITGGAITGFTLYSSGQNYAASDVIVIQGDGTSAAATVSSVLNGCVKNIAVSDGGSNYPPNTTVTYNSSNGGSVNCTLSTTIGSSGDITSVNVITEGHGYSTLSTAFGLMQEDGSSYLLDELSSSHLQYDLSTDQFVISGSTAPIIDLPLGSNGEISGIEFVNAGSGYWDPTEITPTKIVVTDVTGNGVVAVPVIENGLIVSARILDSGYGYSGSPTVTIVGGGTYAVLAANVINTQIVSFSVINSGFGYHYGTSALIYGGAGYGATVDLAVETGITTADVTFGGEFYYVYALLNEDGSRILSESFDGIQGDISATITITDPTGVGAQVEPIVDPITTAITGINIISRGTGYTNPSYTIAPDYSSNPNICARFNIKADRHIKTATITNRGSGYDGCNVFILGDGRDGKLNAIAENNGSITNVNLMSSGSGMIKTPSFSIIDYSGYGAVSSISISDNGEGYREVPILRVAETTGTKAKIIAISSSIGQVQSFDYTHGGYGYDEMPSVVFPIALVMKNNAPFVIGETVTLKNKISMTNDSSYALLTEDSDYISTEEDPSVTDNILIEDGYNLLSEIDDYLNLEFVNRIDQVEGGYSTYNFSGNVYDIDFERQLLYIMFDTIGTDLFNVVTESGDSIINEVGLNIVYENSAGIEENDVLYGNTTGSTATVWYINRASGFAQANGIHHSAFKFENDIGKLNNPSVKLHNNERIQDFAYVMTTGLSLNQYIDFIKKTVHPAGYGIYGDVAINMFNDKDDLILTSPSGTLLQLLSLYISLTPGHLSNVNSSYRFDSTWLENNKFLMNTQASVQQRLLGTDGTLFNLMTETDDLIVQETYRRVQVAGDYSLATIGDRLITDTSLLPITDSSLQSESTFA